MAITSRDQLIAALANSNHVLFDKASISNAVAGRFYSLWRAAGQPGAGAIPTQQEVCTRLTLGALTTHPRPEPLLNYLAWVDVAGSLATHTLEIHDRICHMGGLVGNEMAPQTASLPLTLNGVDPGRIGPEDFSQLQWWLEWYINTGSTAANATVTVVADDDTVHNVVVPLVANSRASGLYQILPPEGTPGIKAVNSVQLSASTGAAGNFGVTCTRYRAGFFTVVANRAEMYDWAHLGLPEVHEDACLFLIQLCTANTTGISKGVARFVAG